MIYYINVTFLKILTEIYHTLFYDIILSELVQYHLRQCIPIFDLISAELATLVYQINLLQKWINEIKSMI